MVATCWQVGGLVDMHDTLREGERFSFGLVKCNSDACHPCTLLALLLPALQCHTRNT